MDRALRVVIIGGLLLLTATVPLVAQNRPVTPPDSGRLPSGSRPVKISGDHPTLTPQARAARAQGTLGVRIQIESDGAVSDATLVDSLMWEDPGPPGQEVEGRKIDMQTTRVFSVRDLTAMGMNTQVRTTLKKWRFRPATINGKPVASAITMEFPFTLDGK